ncbi:hypothetical protein SAMN05443377_10162 [Propionibacterium cyclohexanicum]|uniref:Uncharacterized protein n=1 Tax=Propionibacterium cyclohexanicum TaxID=64702 RepID=A0A1H9PI62_9ACTN|nr:hypothetical protein [Propionibacterium cyclohexanicum]SER47922.1 hypothetical protein SAMN05443377_10162 [Propionibacterium cyclohexanicum]
MAFGIETTPSRRSRLSGEWAVPLTFRGALPRNGEVIDIGE